MNEKEMVAHIKALTRIIEKQFEYTEQLTRKIYILISRIAKLEGMKDMDID